MNITKFESILATTKILNDDTNMKENSFENIRDGFISRTMKCVDIYNSVLEFVKHHFQFLIDNGYYVRKEYGIAPNRYWVYCLGGHRDIYRKEYNNPYDIVVKFVENVGVSEVEIKHINEDASVILNCSSYEYNNGVKVEDKGYLETFIKSLNNPDNYKNFNWIEKVSIGLSNTEKYYTKVFLPMFELFLEHIRESAEYRNKTVTALGNNGSRTVVHKITIEITEEVK